MGNSTYWEKKLSLIAFRQVLTKILPISFIQLHIYELFEKNWLKLSPLIQKIFQQDYIPESYARYLLSYANCQKNVAPYRCGLSPLFLNLYTKPWGWGKILPNSQKFTDFPPKFPLIDLNLSISKVTFISHQISIFKQSPDATFICSCSYFCCIIFWISGFMYTHVVLFWLINVYWMLLLAWEKHWTIEAFPSKISIPSLPPMLFWKPCYY